MDCKIAGTEKGITGFQLDLKLKGLPHAIMDRLRWKKPGLPASAILAEMAKTISEPRKEISKYAPRTTTCNINPREDRCAHRYQAAKEHQASRRGIRLRNRH